MTDKEMAESIMRNEYETLIDKGFEGSWQVYQSAWIKATSYADYIHTCMPPAIATEPTVKESLIVHHAIAQPVANCDPQTSLKLLALVESADNYYRRYCQGEAAETGPEDTGCTLAQHEDALSLRDALAALAALDKS